MYSQGIIVSSQGVLMYSQSVILNYQDFSIYSQGVIMFSQGVIFLKFNPWKMSPLEKVPLENFLSGKRPSGKFPLWKMSALENVLSGICPHWKMSSLENLAQIRSPKQRRFCYHWPEYIPLSYQRNIFQAFGLRN